MKADSKKHETQKLVNIIKFSISILLLIKLMQEVTGKASVKLCIKTFGMSYESSHGFLRITSLIDGKSYFR